MSAERRLALADQDRRAVDEQPVDQIGGEEGGGGLGAALDQQVVDVGEGADRLRAAKPGAAVDGRAGGEQGPARRAVLEARQAHVEPRLVRLVGAAADQDHVAAGAFEMGVGARFLAGDPFAFAGGQRDPAVDRHGELQRDIGTAEPDAGEEAGHAALGLFRHQAGDRPRFPPIPAARCRGRWCADRDRRRRSPPWPGPLRRAGSRRRGRGR